MPAKNIIKSYVEGGYYHIYNRGVEKRNIFLEERDCQVFLHYLKLYLSPPEELLEMFKQDKTNFRLPRFLPQNLSSEVDLLSFSLMPNHFHFQTQQHSKDGVIKFMRRICTSYASYFNKKYTRVGSLFQGAYKAVLIESDEQLLHLSRYIHLNPTTISSPPLNFLNFSSYPYYLGERTASWVKPEEILTFFRSAKKKDFKDMLSYQSFVEDNDKDAKEILGNLVLEEEF